MKVVILCGGKGTRIRDVAENIPKPMVEIGGKPILWHIMKMYASFGLKKFILCLGYKQEHIREYFLNYEFMNNDFTVDLRSREKTAHHKKHSDDWKVTLVDTGEETKKGRRIKLIEPYIRDSHFMVTYGDGLANVNIDALLRLHLEQKKTATFTGAHPFSRFATVSLDKHKQVVSWKEKRPIDDYVSAGFFVFKKEIFDYLGKDEELEEGPMETLARERQVAMYRHEGFWQCMDTYRDHQLLEKMWHAGNTPWKVW